METNPTPSPSPTPAPKDAWYRRLTKKQWTIIGAGAIVAGSTAAAGLAYYQHQHQPICDAACQATSPTPQPQASPTPPPTPTPDPRQPARLNGVLTDPADQNYRPLAVMIENHPEARPQSGLGKADLVYEATAEGGITRFMAVFGQPMKSVRVGPVRSARTYFVDFATELRAFYAHVGGSSQALRQIQNTGVLDLDQFSVGSAAYARDLSRNVALEHTMYSATDKLWQVATQARQMGGEAEYEPWTFADDLPAAQRPASHQVNVAVSDSLYAVQWNYQPESNSYRRSMAGSIHVDAVDNQPITANTLVIQNVAKSLVNDPGQKPVWQFTLTGSGSGTVIKNGVAIPATWRKEGTGRTRFYDQEGVEIPMNRGLIWYHVVHSDSVISY